MINNKLSDKREFGGKMTNLFSVDQLVLLWNAVEKNHKCAGQSSATFPLWLCSRFIMMSEFVMFRKG